MAYLTKVDLRLRALSQAGIKIPPEGIVTNSIGMPLVFIPPGEFDMGSTPEEIAWAMDEGKKSNEGQWYFDRY